MAKKEHDKAVVEFDAETLRSWIEEQPEFEHLDVEVRGLHLTIFSEDEGGKDRRVRFSYLGQKQYGVSFMLHNGRWERSHYVGPLSMVFDSLKKEAGWYLDQW
jgi:hypothetical protein